MNKKELVKRISVDTGLSQRDCQRALDAFQNIVVRELSAGGEVRLTGFGKFETKVRKARVTQNPSTKKPMEITARRLPAFRVGSGLKKHVH